MAVAVVCIIALFLYLADNFTGNIPGSDGVREQTPIVEDADPQEDADASMSSPVGDAREASSLSVKDEGKNMPLSGMTVGIDPGHQGRGNSDMEPVAPDSSEKKAKVTSGTSGVLTRTPEHELNLAVALELRDILEERGAEVVMTRDSRDADISNKERAEFMNQAKVDFCIRIHANGGNPSQSGAMMLVPDGHVPEAVETSSREAGEIIFKAYLAETGAKNLGVIPRSDMTGFNWSKVPVCLIEMGFMTNKAEDELMETEAYRNKCALGLANGIEAYLNKRG
jgi:N-acetylmuramoyl-L-alanine amidase